MAVMDTDIFSQEFKKYRQAARRYDISELATSSGVSRRSIHFIESGRVIPNAATLNKLIFAMRLPEEYAAHLRQLRDLSQAKRDGFQIPGFQEDSAEKLAQSLAGETAFFLLKHRIKIFPYDQRLLAAALQQTIQSFLAAP
jgi:DNA-binding XRE family transcriptional regulator